MHDAANVLRRYLNDLPEPVVPLDLYEKFREPLRGATRQAVGDAEGPQFVENFDMDAAIAKYQQLITELPPLNRQLMLYILDLLAVFAAKSDQNRMNAQNLAAIFQPGMLSHPNHAMAPEEYRLNQCVIIFLIENQDNFLIGMQGTAADEKTVQEVQKGTPVINAPTTPTKGSGISRSASTASAGAESVAKDGQIRRNKSTSSRRSLHSNGAQSPHSPALVSTPTGGLARSNTVPSKKSPALQSGRFANRNDLSAVPVTPLTPLSPPATAVASPPTVVEEVATPPEEQSAPSFQASSIGNSSLSPGQSVTTGRSQEGLLEPTVEVPTPSKERRLPSLFQRIPGENDGRQPNKLRKKMPNSAHPSAHSSTTSLPYSQAASPNVEAITNPFETVSSPPRAPVGRKVSNDMQRTEQPSESTSRLAHVTSNSNSLHPNSAETALKSKRSPPTSLHSSFNEGSDVEQLDEAVAATTAPVEVSAAEKEKRSRWRLSRKKEDNNSISSPPPVASPPRAGLGAHSNAEGSTSTVGSSGYKPGNSVTGGESSSDLAMVPTGGDATHSIKSDGSYKDSTREEKSLGSWLKNKYREHKENVQERRNKSPPASDRSASIGSTFLGSSRGKSLDLRREGPYTNEEQQQLPNPPMPLPIRGFQGQQQQPSAQVQVRQQEPAPAQAVYQQQPLAQQPPQQYSQNPEQRSHQQPQQQPPKPQEVNTAAQPQNEYLEPHAL